MTDRQRAGRRRRPPEIRPLDAASPPVRSWAPWLLIGMVLSAPAASQQLTFEEFAVSHAAFSPNNDGVQDADTVSARLSIDAFLRVQVESGGSIVRTLLDSVSVPAGDQRLVWDGLIEGSDDPVEGTYTVRASAWSGGQFAAAEPRTVVLDLTDPVHVSTELVDGGPLFRDRETLLIDTTWDAEGYGIFPDFTALDSDTLGGLIRTPMGATTRLAYTISAQNTRADDDSILVPIRAVDPAGNGTADTTLVVGLRNRPTPLGSAPEDSVRTVRNGQTVVIFSEWDQEGYGIDADFGNVDDGDAEPPAVADIGDGVYRITYTVSEENTVPDGDSLAVPITATSRFGETFTDGSLFLCLSNQPPVHIDTRMADGRRIFKNGDTLRVETQWRSPAGLPLGASGDFQGISTRFDLGEDSFAQVDDTTFVVTYRLPTTNEAMDADSILIPIFGEDAGCGRTTSRTLWLALDNTPPEDVPVLDLLPKGTTERRLLVSGSVANQPAAAVYSGEGELLEDFTLLGSGATDETGRFSVMITLEPGLQVLSARSLDVAGNASEPSASQQVVLVEEDLIDVPKPFRSGDAIIAQNPVGWDQLDLTLINLEGGLVREWSFASPGRYIEIRWNGRNASGAQVNSGPFLLKWEGTFSGGGRQEKLLPVLYLR